MITRVLKATVAATLAVPMLATASVTWHFDGTVISTSVPAPVSVGDPFSVELIFDPATPLTYSPTSDVYFGSSPSSIVMTFGSISVGPITKAWNGVDNTGYFFLRDDSVFNALPPRDALVYHLDQDNGDGTTNGFDIRLRSYDLDLITNHTLPIAPDPRWTQGNTPGANHNFDVCLTDATCTGGELLVRLTSVSAVPEPGTSALLIAGVACLGGLTRWRRRRTD